jgi:CubicO group peptidase (beta-lactamase class C family)
MRVKCLFILLCFLNVSRAQLSNDIQVIRQQHDLMGGVVTLFCADAIQLNIPFGTADFTRDIPVSDSTMFRIASISKTVTAMAFMKLVDNNLVGLDDPISPILGYTVQNPFFPATAITPRMLLSHTSTIIDGSTYSSFLNATYSQNPIPNMSELVSAGGSYYTTNQFNNIQPGTYFNYSNINYGILGTLIEKIAGVRFDEYCRNELFIPLGIKGSFNVNQIDNIDNVGVLYRKIAGNWTPQADNFQGNQPVFSNLTGYTPGTNGARFAPQGGLRCSGTDLSKLFMVLLNKGEFQGLQLLSEHSVQLMLSNQWTYNGNNGNNYFDLFNSWGLGTHRIVNIPNADVVLEQSLSMFGHPGEAYGLVSDAYIDTTRKLGFVFMTNGCGAGYQLSSSTAFYTVEKQVFEALDPYANALSCESLNTQESTAIGLKFWPNPTNGMVNISGVNQPIKIEIRSMLGQILQTISIDKDYSIDLNPYSPGIYLIHSGDGELYRIIKN